METIIAYVKSVEMDDTGAFADVRFSIAAGDIPRLMSSAVGSLGPLAIALLIPIEERA